MSEYQLGSFLLPSMLSYIHFLPNLIIHSYSENLIDHFCINIPCAKNQHFLSMLLRFTFLSVYSNVKHLLESSRFKLLSPPLISVLVHRNHARARQVKVMSRETLDICITTMMKGQFPSSLSMVNSSRTLEQAPEQW